MLLNEEADRTVSHSSLKLFIYVHVAEIWDLYQRPSDR